jgi:molybdopterin synthase catalytic subunit
MQCPDAGALVVFEGRVRNVNQGRPVTCLEYEGAEALAGREFARIEADVLDRFDVLDVHCVHRVGTLKVGDIAVWIGVVAAHRAAAFEACRYTIDELKQRLPIWKKEVYTDGNSGWINSP